MPTRDSRGQQESLSDAEVERLLTNALRLTGEFPPSSLEEIAQLEAELTAHPIPLPEALKDTDAIYQRASQPPRAVVVPFTASDAAKEQLARAAREGREVSETAAERMKRDREAAENEQQPR
jgi:hypothetical protein